MYVVIPILSPPLSSPLLSPLLSPLFLASLPPLSSLPSPLSFQAEADEDIPESLEGIVKRKLADPGASELCSLTSEDYPESLESSLAADRQLEEAARLKQVRTTPSLKWRVSSS